MAKKIIILGQLDKKLILPFCLAITHILINVHYKYYPAKMHSVIFDNLPYSLGFIGIRLIPCILRFSPNNKEKIKFSKKQIFLHYFLLIFFFIIFIGMQEASTLLRGYYTDGSYEPENPYTKSEFLKLCIQIIFMNFISIILLKYKYFKHHYISIIILLIFDIICDICLDYYNKNFKYAVVTIFDYLIILIDSLNFYYQKYMMEKLYYPYWNVGLSTGLTMFFFSFLKFLITIFDQDKANSENVLVSSFFLYFEKVHPGLIILKMVIYLILGFFLNTLSILSIYYYNPNYTLVALHLGKYSQVLIDEPFENYYCIILFLLQFFCLMIYLEIIELNFCGLNKNTRRNIELRGINDYIGKCGRDSSLELNIVDVDDGYFIKQTGENGKEDILPDEKSDYSKGDN